MNSISATYRFLAFWALLSITGHVYAAQEKAATMEASARCAALAGEDFSQTPDALIQVAEAKLIAPGRDTVGYCEVSGYVQPSVGFLLRLPTEKWNERFIEIGCGGACGDLSHVSECDTPLRRGYACIVSDIGHEGPGLIWAYHNLQGQIDWAFRADHVAALTGKAILAGYYHRTAQKSYMMGCSAGGHEGLIAVQRFPWDFDGVIVGAPSISMQTWGLDFVWRQKILRGRDGHPLLTSADAQLLHDTAVAQCDMDDGVKDGVIGNPSACNVDFDQLLCRGGKTSRCLTSDQLRAVKMRYAGPMTASGTLLTPGGAAPGSENNWLDDLVGTAEYARDLYGYVNFSPAPGPQWKLSDFDFDRDYKRLGVIDTFYGASNPDLRQFNRAGGKLLVYQGWNDAGVLPAYIVDYYKTVVKTMGGLEPTQAFFRLFMIPGMNHCSGGDGAFAVDYLTYMENWVEKGIAPEALIGAHVRNDYLEAQHHPWGIAGAIAELKFPLSDSIPVQFTRPIYPYPLRAKYKGTGDPNDATNFEPARP